MGTLYTRIFAAAIGAAAFIAFATAPHAQEAKKAPADKAEMKKDEAAKGGDDGRRMREIAQADLAEVAAGKLGARLKLVQSTAKNAKDPALKADAEKTAPKIQEHLEMAKKIAAGLKK